MGICIDQLSNNFYRLISETQINNLQYEDVVKSTEYETHLATLNGRIERLMVQNYEARIQLHKEYATHGALTGKIERLVKENHDIRNQLQNATTENDNLKAENTKFKLKLDAGKSNDRADTTKDVWCSCRQTEYGQMIACDNVDCKFKWFHMNCVGLSIAPKGDWICHSCAL